MATFLGRGELDELQDRQANAAGEFTLNAGVTKLRIIQDGFSNAAKEIMLDALTANQVRLHNGNPGSAGTENQIGDPEEATFLSASGDARDLQTNVDFVGLDPQQPVTWFSVWTAE